jgi:BirA family biotin operon repressor/biotin-[acetyl-CoA-carboxylase] ligase
LELDLSSIRSSLHTRSLGREILLVDECTSTNNLASRLAVLGAKHGFTVIAEKQIEGRGRHGRAWISPRGGIWMTIILRPLPDFRPLDGLPLIGALAVALALNSVHGIEALVRWPNDVTVHARKIAGILVEASLRGNTVASALLGVGLNANFHANMMEVERATTLLDILGSSVDREELISSILLSAERLYDQVSSGSSRQVLELLKQNDASQGQKVVVQLETGKLEGVLEDYQTLTRVRILEHGTSHRLVETSSVISVDYPDV